MTRAAVLIQRIRLLAIVATLACAFSSVAAQEHPVKRVANIVTVALEEYAKDGGRDRAAEEQHGETLRVVLDLAPDRGREKSAKDHHPLVAVED